MGTRIKEVDQYIHNAEPFAQPILIHLRELIHSAHPEIKESIKWGMPHFEYKGNLCGVASFKKHCAFGFWKAAIMTDSHGIFGSGPRPGMGDLGRVRSLEDLPPDSVLTEMILEAIDLNERNIPLPKKTISKAEVTPPDDFLDALDENELAHTNFSRMSPSHRKEYIEWIEDAKREETRLRRISTAVQMLSEGKSRNWKYQ